MSDQMNLPVNYENLQFTERKKVRLEYIRIQEGKCHFCGEKLTGNPSKSVESKWINIRLFPENFFKHPVHLHHSHETGMTIGAVHAKCNAVLWQYHGE